MHLCKSSLLIGSVTRQYHTCSHPIIWQYVRLLQLQRHNPLGSTFLTFLAGGFRSTFSMAHQRGIITEHFSNVTTVSHNWLTHWISIHAANSVLFLCVATLSQWNQCTPAEIDLPLITNNVNHSLSTRLNNKIHIKHNDSGSSLNEFTTNSNLKM